jgi:hypothetical protein
LKLEFRATHLFKTQSYRISCKITRFKSAVVFQNNQEVGWAGMNWIDLAQDRGRWRALVNAEMNIRVPENAENLLTS